MESSSVYSNTFLRGVHQVERGLLQPLDYCVSTIIETVASSEKMGYVAVAGKVSLLSVGVLLSLIPAIFSVALRLALKPFQAEIVYLKPEKPLGEVSGEKTTVLTHNVAWSEFETMNRINHLEGSVFERAEKWLAWFHSLEAKPDVVNLQEAFDLRSVHYVAEKLCEQGYFVCYTGQAAMGGLGLTSGLLIATKEEPTSIHFERYQEACSEDRFANKGILRVAMKGGLVCVNTHMQAKVSHPSLAEVQCSQTTQLIRALKDAPLLLGAGDFNQTGGELALVGFFPWRFTPSVSGTFITLPEGSVSSNGDIDHVFYKGAGFERPSPTVVDLPEHFTDHRPLFCELTKKTGAEDPRRDCSLASAT